MASFDIAQSLDLSWMKLATSILSGGSKGNKQEKPKDTPAKTDSVPKQKKGETSLFQKMMKGPQIGMNLAHMAQAYVAIQNATENDNLEDGVYLSGQVQGIIHDIPTVTEVINRTVGKVTKIQKDMADKAV